MAYTSLFRARKALTTALISSLFFAATTTSQAMTVAPEGVSVNVVVGASGYIDHADNVAMNQTLLWAPFGAAGASMLSSQDSSEGYERPTPFLASRYVSIGSTNIITASADRQAQGAQVLSLDAPSKVTRRGAGKVLRA